MFSKVLKYKKVIIGTTAATLGVALYQGIKSRDEYNENYKIRTIIPNGPRSGIEFNNWSNKLTSIKTKILNKKDIILHDIDIEEQKFRKRIEKLIDDIKLKASNMNTRLRNKTIISDDKNENQLNHQIKKKKKIKLLVLGDSLVSGVGCDSIDSSPVLPKVLAKVLSVALNREVEWYSAGIIGATAKDIHDKLIPNTKNEIKSILLNNTDKVDLENTKLVVVIICGLNDWKHMIENFPHGMGLEDFKSNLGLLVHDIKELSDNIGVKCDVFLPAIPINCTATDPSCYFKARPLKDVVEFVSWLWDMQKQAVARDDKDARTWFINVPELESSFSTAGPGTVCADRIHPSSQGYQWWATHIAAEILSVYDIDA